MRMSFFVGILFVVAELASRATATLCTHRHLAQVGVAQCGYSGAQSFVVDSVVVDVRADANVQSPCCDFDGSFYFVPLVPKHAFEIG